MVRSLRFWLATGKNFSGQPLTCFVSKYRSRPKRGKSNALTPAGKVDEQSRLCQSCKVTPEVHEIRMPDKLRTVEQLAKLFDHGACSSG
jgi:hypothetical protein